jgi:hypothetical protein
MKMLKPVCKSKKNCRFAHQRIKTKMSTISAPILEKNYKDLILQVSLNDVSFRINDTLRNRIDFLDRFSFENISNPTQTEEALRSFFDATPEFQTKFDKITVLHNNNLLTFIPSVLFDEQYIGSYLQFNTKVFESDFYTHDVISNYEMNAIYIPYININNYLIDRFGSFDYKHSFSILVKKVLDFSKNIDEPKLYVHCQENNFQIIAAKNQKLLLFNTFEYKTEADFIYYLLFTAEQLNLNPETLHLKLFGRVSKESNLYQIAYKYIRNISLFFDNNNLEDNVSHQDYLQHFILIHACE